MLRALFSVTVAVLAALGGGAGSAWLLLRTLPALPAAPGWHALPDRAALAENPYRRDPAGSSFAPGGRAGGTLFFAATQSDDGAPLRRNCTYGLSGSMPAARIWTLSVLDGDLVPDGAAHGLPSTDAVWAANGSIDVRIGAEPGSGNWIPLEAKGGAFVLLAALTGLPPKLGENGPAMPPLPAIARLGCGSGDP